MSNNIYAFVIQSKKGENMLVIPNNTFKIDQALYLADRIYDKVLVQFKLKQKVDRHFVIDHNTAGIIYITDHFIFHLFISSAYISVGNDLIKRLVQAFNATKMIDAASLEKKFFEVYFMLNSTLYQKFIDHRQFHVNTKNIYTKQQIDDKLCDKEILKIRFGSMQAQSAGSTLSSKIMEEKDAIQFIPYKYAKKNYNSTKVSQFLASFNSKVEIPASVYKSNHIDQRKEMIRNKLYQYAFQMKIKSNAVQNDQSRVGYPLNRNNIKNIQKIKPQIQSFSSKEMQLLQQKYGNNVNHQIIQENIENKSNDVNFNSNSKNQRNNDNESPIKPRKGEITSAQVSESKKKNNIENNNHNQVVVPFHNNINNNNNNNILEENNNQIQNKENEVQQNNQIQQQDQLQIKQQFHQQQQPHQIPNSIFNQQNQEDLLDFDFDVNLKDGNQNQENYIHNNQQIEFFSNQQANNFNHFQSQQQQKVEIDLI